MTTVQRFGLNHEFAYRVRVVAPCVPRVCVLATVLPRDNNIISRTKSRSARRFPTTKSIAETTRFDDDLLSATCGVVPKNQRRNSAIFLELFETTAKKYLIIHHQRAPTTRQNARLLIYYKLAELGLFTGLLYIALKSNVIPK